MYAKVFTQIFDSSIAEDHQIRHVFMDLLVLADSDGVVDMTAEAISRRTNVPIEVVTRAITVLSEPDQKSRSHESGGRRLTLIDSHRDWGWRITNYAHYRRLRDEEGRRSYFRDYARKKRKVTLDHTSSPLVTGGHLKSTHAEGEAEAEAKGGKPKPPLSSEMIKDEKELARINKRLDELKEADYPSLIAERKDLRTKRKVLLDKHGWAA